MINLSKFLRSIHITKFSFYLLILLIILSFSITFYLLLPNNQLVKDPQNLQFLLLADVIFVIILLSIIIRQILLVFIYKKKNIGESRLYIKFINLFTAMALFPAIGVVVITSLFFNLELQTWYGGAVRDAVVSSNIVARDYENEIQSELISDIQLITREIIKVSRNNEVQKNSIERVLREFINIRTISNIYLFNRQGDVFLSFEEDQKIEKFSFPNNSIFSLLDKNQIYIFQQNENSISAYKKLNFLNDIFVQVNRNLSKNIWKHISETRRAYEIYTLKEEESSGIQITFSMIFVLFSLCFILIAVLIGFNLARRLSKPISNLIESANEISKGNFDAKVSEDDQFDEVKVLLTSYNKMINEIQLKQNQILNKSEEDETKRIFIEAILSLLTIGVISLDDNFNVNFFNKSSLRILGKISEDLEKKNFLNIFPEWSKIVDNFKKSKRLIENFQIEIMINDNARNLNLRIIKEIKENSVSGYVVTIDDMTSLILAEKHAAWSDIAKKIAHEVKNPLTPIKLAAERIEKKIIEKSINFKDINNLTQTISKQVDGIGKLIDEFSSFARMPKAETKLDNLSKTLKESFNLFVNSYPKVNIKLLSKTKDIYFQFDRFQITQAFNNIIKNSVEAVINIPNPSITLDLLENNNQIEFIVKDNGVGVDENKISKYFEPYFTTKDKGTGLGLSIVKKIIEDHGGIIKIEKNKNMAGTTTVITFDI
ncbi:MAG: GHKL domain-containing protein [Pelagibacteraceae bacterium]|nr:GHKL domain-containing protein [Pelagibacteraceae bacterium]MBO6471016.1 GHKL domain-containing protein [Pelagibacteraceae bacterium]MBO6471968.1 GHKL domain-containing protein [Pelagibacteraceae bacterium]MBO6479563.1 GHKL domain-containing protein [Pelagibacteraceae bacterium]HJO13932.1 ATP-binding protein [Alphaproteobacteria bacterium]